MLYFILPACFPCEKWHDSVVNHVQCRDVVILLSQDEEHGVEKLGELGEVIPPEVK